MESLLNISSLSVQYGKGEDKVHAVQSVDFTIAHGEIFGLVGESGSGKSTIGKSIVGLVTPEKGSVITYEDRDLTRLNRREKHKVCKEIQMVFQDPYGSLNPRMKVGEALLDVMQVHGLKKNRVERLDYAKELFKAVGLSGNMLMRYPHEFSGGQRQRICIARALVLEPKLIIADEPVSALDVSVQAEVLSLMKRLQENRGIAFLFISHDLAVVRELCDRVAVMYAGKFVESGDAEHVIDQPSHDYTKRLVNAVPSL